MFAITVKGASGLDVFLFWGSMVLLGLLFVAVLVDTVKAVLAVRADRRFERALEETLAKINEEFNRE